MTPAAPTLLDRLATARGISWLEPLLMPAFIRRLTGSVPLGNGQTKQPRMTLLTAVKFILRFFFLSDPSSTSSSSSPAVPRVPQYDGSARSVRAICRWVLKNPTSPSTFTFPSSLEKEDRHQVHLIVDEVGEGKIQHMSTGTGSRRALTLTRSGRARGEGGAEVADPLAEVFTLKAVENANVPRRWIAVVTRMCDALYGELTEGHLQRLSFKDVVPLTSHALLMTSLYQLQKIGDPSHPEDYHDSYIGATRVLTSSTVARVDSTWTKAREATLHYKNRHRGSRHRRQSPY